MLKTLEPELQHLDQTALTQTSLCLQFNLADSVHALHQPVQCTVCGPAAQLYNCSSHLLVTRVGGS